MMDIPGFPGFKADESGGIHDCRTQNIRTKKQTRTRNGYLAVTIYTEDGQPCTRYSHRLVWSAFNGPIPAKMDVCHNDGVRTNNVLANLRADTRAGNLLDRHKHGTMNRGERCGTAILNADQVRAIRLMYDTGNHTQEELATMFGVSRSSILAITRKWNWAHI